MKIKHKFTIDIETFTEIKGKVITQRVALLSTRVPNGEELFRRVCDTSEEELRRALVKLGWTPPKSEPVELIDIEHF